MERMKQEKLNIFKKIKEDTGLEKCTFKPNINLSSRKRTEKSINGKSSERKEDLTLNNMPKTIFKTMVTPHTMTSEEKTPNRYNNPSQTSSPMRTESFNGFY